MHVHFMTFLKFIWIFGTQQTMNSECKVESRKSEGVDISQAKKSPCHESSIRFSYTSSS